MEARVHYSATALLLVAPTPAPSTSAGALPAAEAAENGRGGGSLAVSFKANAIVLLSLLVCGLVAAVALHVVLQCALRVTRRACHGADDVAPHETRRAGAGEGRARRGGGGRKRTAAPPLSKTIPRVAYTEGLELAGSARSECAICLAEFASGEQVRVLPRCNHGFHERCIDRWLAARLTCPTCRQPPFPADAEPVAPDPAPATTTRDVPVVRVIVITSQ
uniref:RING-type domain-containing protein n=1 Tax=Leersia perrieri TaxID=77586 RepID=A0A0D9WH03_9ORYZ